MVMSNVINNKMPAKNNNEKPPAGNKIRSTIESLFHRSSRPKPTPDCVVVVENNNAENDKATTKQPQRTNKNKWNSIPGIRRSLSNLFVQQKQKHQQNHPTPQPAPANNHPNNDHQHSSSCSSTAMTVSSSSGRIDDEHVASCQSFVVRREMELSRGNNNTCPQQNGPLVRLRHADHLYQQNHQQQPSARSTNTLSSSSGASSSAAVTSRQSTNGDGNSADSGYSPTEPEMMLVPHPATNGSIYRNKMQLSTSMYLQRCSHHSGTSSGNNNDLEKSLDSLSSGDQNRGQAILLDRHTNHEGDEGEEDEVVLGDWPLSHLRNRGAISSPNIPRLVRRNVPPSAGVQRFRPEPDQQQEEQLLDDTTDEEEEDRNEMEDDFDDDFMNKTQPCIGATGSLCRLTMSSFCAQNELLNGTRQQLRRPRRIRAVSDHSLHRRSKEQRAQERELMMADADNSDSFHQQRQDLLSSVTALSSSSNSATPSTLVKSATLGALASSHKSRVGPKILSDVPRAEFTLTNSTTFFNKSESNLVDHRQQAKPAQMEPSRPLPAPPKNRPPLSSGQRASAALLLQSELQQSQQSNSTFTYGRPFTILDPAANSNLTFEVTPIIPPQVNAMPQPPSNVQPVMNNSMLGSQPANCSLAPLTRINAATTVAGPTIPPSTSPNSSASSSIENAPTKTPPLPILSNPSSKLLSMVPTNCSTSTTTTGDSTDAGGPGDLQQQEQVFRRFGCQRLLEMQRRIEENCRLSERQQNEQEAVTRLLTNIRRNIRTTEI